MADKLVLIKNHSLHFTGVDTYNKLSKFWGEKSGYIRVAEWGLLQQSLMVFPNPLEVMRKEVGNPQGWYPAKCSTFALK